MELNLEPLATACVVSGQPFVEGDRVLSYLVRKPDQQQQGLPDGLVVGEGAGIFVLKFGVEFGEDAVGFGELGAIGAIGLFVTGEDGQEEDLGISEQGAGNRYTLPLSTAEHDTL